MKKLMTVMVYVANRPHLISVIYVASLVLSATTFSYFENKSWWDGLWWSVVTALTIGYGDLAPATVPGRLCAMFLSHVWIFGIIPMIVANLVVRMIVDKDKFTNAEQEWQKEVLRDLAIHFNINVPAPPPDH